MKTTWNHETFLDSVKNHRYTFACTPREFFIRFGDIAQATKDQAEEVKSLAVFCRDGIIRPR